MDSWWRLGEGTGYMGADLAKHHITCPFCMEGGGFKTVAHFEKRKPGEGKRLNFDTLECGNCKGYVMVLWSASTGGRGLHAFEVLPWPLKLEKHPDHWPKTVGRHWLEARRNQGSENWESTSVTARSALQAALRDKGAKGRTFHLVAKGELPPLMNDWATEVRVLGNEAAHPQPDQEPTDPDDARDVVKFLDFLLEYLYNLPERIREFRERKA